MEKTDNQVDGEVKRINEIAMEVLNDKIIHNASDLDDLLDELQSWLSKELDTEVEIAAEYEGEEEGEIYIYLTITTPHGKYATSIVLTRAYEVSLALDVYPTEE
jgi:flagellar hook-associated protein FlgK